MSVVRRVNYSATILALLAAVTAFAQNVSLPADTIKAPAANTLAFDVASIKPASPNESAWHLLPTPDGYTGMNVSLRKLIELAYGVLDGKLIIGGPPWIDSVKFDLEAKFDPALVPNLKDLTYRQRADMLQPLLADRLKLKIHHEPRDFAVFLLVVDKHGPKLHESTPPDTGNPGFGIDCTFRNKSGSLTAQGCQASSLTGLLQSAAGRIILDRTGLTGHYNMELHWTPDNATVDASSESGPSIFTALQEQLGLKLEPSTAPLDVLVIDSAEKPSEN
jgi:uncharacterized protein (TIGR03435 family)